MCDQQLHGAEYTSELQASNTLEILSNYRVTKGSVAQQTNSDARITSSSISSILKLPQFTILSAKVSDVLEYDSYNSLSSIYSNSIKEPNRFVKCLCCYQKIPAIMYNGRIFGSLCPDD